MPTSMPAHSAHAHPAISVRQASRHFGDLCVFGHSPRSVDILNTGP